MLQNIFRNSSRNGRYLYKINQVIFSQSLAALATKTAVTVNDTLLEQAHIDEAVRVNPSLAGVSNENWHKVHTVLLNHGLYTSNFLRIVTGNPVVLRQPTQKTIDSIELWRSCQFGEKLLYLLLTKYPEFLNATNDRRLRTHISYLKSVAGSSKNVWKLLMNSPDVMEQSEQRLEGKINYIQQVMRIEVPEIVKSEALSQSFEELRCRHVFLERLGLFKARSPKLSPDEPTKNPRLYQITDTSEKTFATKICHVSLPEYEAFKELYEREQQNKLSAAEDADLSDDD